MIRELYKFSKRNSLALNQPLNLYFCLDTSVYMEAPVITFGKTRLEVMINSVKNILTDVAKMTSSLGISIDVGLCRMDGVEVIRRNFKPDDLSYLFTWLDIIPEDGISSTCPFNIPMAKSRTYFLASQRDDYSRHCFFISYGNPDPVSSATTAQTENSDMINNTSSFATYPVSIHGVGVDSMTLSYLNFLDNTNGSVKLNDNDDENEIDRYILEQIQPSSENWYFTSADSDDSYDGNTYVATCMGRGNIELKREIEKQKIEIEFPISNEFAKNWLIDSNYYFLDVQILEKESSTVRQIWEGRLVSVAISGKKFKLEFESIFTALARYGLKRIYQRSCPHTLYNRGCNLNINDFEILAAISDINKLICTISTSKDDHFYTHGLLKYGDEFVSIRSQIGNQFELTRLLPGMEAELASLGYVIIHIFPGCNKSKVTCLEKFDNLVNYGGYPYILNKNPFGRLIL